MGHFALMFGWFKNSSPLTTKALDAIGHLSELTENYPLHVLDISLLPMPKQQLKAALKEFWRASSRPQRLAFEVGYVSLANFQDGVGPKPISLKSDATIAWMKRTSEERTALFEDFATFKRC